MKEVDNTWKEKLCLNSHIHMIGIGGMGMAGLALLLKDQGMQITGCDEKFNNQVNTLKAKGIHIDIEHNISHLDNCDLLIRSTAVPYDNIEVKEAFRRDIPVIQRGYVLAEILHNRTVIAVAGSHGKTSTASILSQILESGYIIGGQIKSHDVLARDDTVIVAEVDESDGTIEQFKPDYTIITNIDDDHLDYYRNSDSLDKSFEKLIKQTKRNVFFNANDLRLHSICQNYDYCIPIKKDKDAALVPFKGDYNIDNASYALMVADLFISRDLARKRLKEIKAVSRRFEILYDKNNIKVILDYAHHPTEIKALYQAASEFNMNRILAIFQPHRYTRTYSFKEDFADLLHKFDKSILLPVFAASEKFHSEGNSESIMKIVNQKKYKNIDFFEDMKQAWSQMMSELTDGDVLLIIGAGDIDQLRNISSCIDTYF